MLFFSQTLKDLSKETLQDMSRANIFVIINTTLSVWPLYEWVRAEP